MQTTVNVIRPAMRSLTREVPVSVKGKAMKLLLKNKREENYLNICTLRRLYVSLQRLNFKRGTDAADKRRQFLYPNISENNTTAPCRVYGNVPGSPAFETLATRSAVFYANKSNVMQTTIDVLSQETKARECLQEKVQNLINSVNHWLNGKSEFYSRIAEFSVTRRTVVLVNAIAVLLIIAGSAVTQRPAFAAASTACAALLVYKLNRKGGKA